MIFAINPIEKCPRAECWCHWTCHILTNIYIWPLIGRKPFFFSLINIKWTNRLDGIENIILLVKLPDAKKNERLERFIKYNRHSYTFQSDFWIYWTRDNGYRCCNSMTHDGHGISTVIINIDVMPLHDNNVCPFRWKKERIIPVYNSNNSVTESVSSLFGYISSWNALWQFLNCDAGNYDELMNIEQFSKCISRPVSMRTPDACIIFSISMRVFALSLK